MLQVFLIRHGETEWSRSGRHTSMTDIPLTEQGEGMARDLTPHLESLSFTHVISSPRQRARQTASLAGFKDKLASDPDLAEWNYGAYEGRRSSDIAQERPDWLLFRDGCPEGETPVQVSERADTVIARLVEMDANVVLFSHGHFSCVLAARWIGLPIIEAQHFSLDPAGIGILSYAAHHPDNRVIKLWNASPSVLKGRL